MIIKEQEGLWIRVYLGEITEIRTFQFQDHKQALKWVLENWRAKGEWRLLVNYLKKEVLREGQNLDDLDWSNYDLLARIYYNTKGMLNFKELGFAEFALHIMREANSRTWEELLKLLIDFGINQIQNLENQIQNLEKAHEEFLDTQLDFYKLSRPILWAEFESSNPSALDVGNLLNFLEAKITNLKTNQKQFLTEQIQLIKGVLNNHDRNQRN